MKRFLFSLVFSLFICSHALSQKEADVFNPTKLVRINVAGLADMLDNNLSTGLEYRYHPNWSAGSDLGWIFASQYLTNNRGANGVMIRPFIRYYPSAQGIGFFEAELHYKYVGYKMEDWLGRVPVNGVPTYQEFTKFIYSKHAAGLHIKGGLQTNLDRKERLFFEVNGGIGIRRKWQGVKDGLYRENGAGITDIFNKNYVGPVLLFNMRLLFAIE